MDPPFALSTFEAVVVFHLFSSLHLVTRSFSPRLSSLLSTRKERERERKRGRGVTD
jgi:hypothetical protein